MIAADLAAVDSIASTLWERSQALSSIENMSEPSLTDDRDRVVQACYDLLLTGRPLSEVIAEVKRLCEIRKVDEPCVSSEAIDVNRGACDSGAPASGAANRVVFERAVSAAVAAHSDLVNLGSSPVAVVEPSTLMNDRAAGASRWEFWNTIRLARSWVVTAFCLAGLLAAAMGAAVLYLPLGGEATAAVGGSAEELATKLFVSRTPQSSAPLTSDPAPAVASPNSALVNPNSAVVNPDSRAATVEPHVTAEQIEALLAHGDALVSMADVTSGRLFYRRAADAGDGRAAIRLGATYDPSFIARAGLSGVRGDMAAAVYWYRRARDLGASEAEILLKGAPR